MRNAARRTSQLLIAEKIFAELTVELDLEIAPDWTLSQRRLFLIEGGLEFPSEAAKRERQKSAA